MSEIRKVGLPISRSDVEAPLQTPLAEHLGTARWLLVVDDDQHVELVRNGGSAGNWIADALAEAGCSDVILAHVGTGAFSALKECGVRLWRGAPGVPIGTLVEQLRLGGLEELASPEHAGPGRGGCCSGG